VSPAGATPPLARRRQTLIVICQQPLRTLKQIVHRSHVRY